MRFVPVLTHLSLLNQSRPECQYQYLVLFATNFGNKSGALLSNRVSTRRCINKHETEQCERHFTFLNLEQSAAGDICYELPAAGLTTHSV